MVQVTLFSSPNCCLCDTAKMILNRIRTQLPFELQEIDINQNMELSKRYGEIIPVILVNGREACRGRIEERKIRGLIEVSASH